MEPGLRTPLIDLFRRGEVGHDVKMLAAQGALAPRVLEQLALLVLLSDDPSPEVAAAARATIAGLPAEQLGPFLGGAEVPDEIRRFFAGRGIEAEHQKRADLGSSIGSQAEGAGPDADPANPDLETAADGRPADTAAMISALPIQERLKMAMKGTREQRAVLIRDPNKIVAIAVLSSPKLSESEVEAFTKMGNVSDEVLRIIGHNRSWTKNYGVVIGLVRNAKTPPAISMTLLSRLNERDIKLVSMDRNVPEALRVAARKYLVKTLNR
jgi:hypothetical protein